MTGTNQKTFAFQIDREAVEARAQSSRRATPQERAEAWERRFNAACRTKGPARFASVF